MRDSKPMTPSEMGKKGRQNFKEKLGSPEAISAYFRKLQIASTLAKKKKKFAAE